MPEFWMATWLQCIALPKCERDKSSSRAWKTKSPSSGIKQEGHRVWLMPENPEFAPIQVDLREQSLAIEGVVVGVVRDSMK